MSPLGTEVEKTAAQLRLSPDVRMPDPGFKSSAGSFRERAAAGCGGGRDETAIRASDGSAVERSFLKGQVSAYLSRKSPSHTWGCGQFCAKPVLGLGTIYWGRGSTSQGAQLVKNYR